MAGGDDAIRMVVQKVHPGGSLTGVVRPIRDKIFRSKCSVGHRFTMPSMQQRLPSLGPSDDAGGDVAGGGDAAGEHLREFSFGLYLAQSCRMLLCFTPAGTKPSGGPATPEFFRKNIVGSGVIR